MEDVVERRFIPHFGFIIYLPLVKAIQTLPRASS